MPTTEEIKLIIRKFALQNAVKYNKTPQAGAVMGKVMAQPELRSKAKEITVLVNEVLVEIDQMTPEAREEELNRLAPELIAELSEKKEPEKGLPPLELDGPLVMRFAPNPNGPPTLGSARGIVVNSEYTKKYNGKLIIRFDDTDPATKRPMLEAYTWYLEDCEWLEAKPDEVVIASDRIERYYEVAEQLIKKGGAYICFCEQESFKALKDVKKACLHRDEKPEKNFEFWKKMLAGDYKEQEAVLRIKTDIAHKDPAIRDWVAFRIIRTPHPRHEVGDKFCVWPLLDFEGAVEDHLLGTTLIIRGKDLTDSETRQRYVYKYMGWTYPRTMHWGRVKIEEGLLDETSISEEYEYFMEINGRKYGVPKQYVRPDENIPCPYEKEGKGYPVAAFFTKKGKLGFKKAFQEYELMQLTSKNGFIMYSETLIKTFNKINTQKVEALLGEDLSEENEYFKEIDGYPYGVPKQYVRPDRNTLSPYEKEGRGYPVAVGYTTKDNIRFKNASKEYRLEELESKNGFIWVSEKLIENIGKLSTSGMKKAIAEGKYTGWDDPGLRTIRALRRRGIRSEAIRKFMIDLGLGETDISLSLDTLYAENRKIVDPIANRYFFVWDPVELEAEGAEPKIAKAPIHPTRGGLREIPAGTKVLITRNDADSLKEGERLRLKDLYNIEVIGVSPLRVKFIGTDMVLVKKEKARIIHWVPVDGLKVRVLSPDGEYTGIGERGMEKELDKVVQFERFGFVRIDSVKDDEVVAYFTHK